MKLNLFFKSSQIYLFFMLILLANINAQERIDPTTPRKEILNDQEQIQKQNLETNTEQKSIPAKCGTIETDYLPCMTREKADSIFSHCCSQYVPQGCHSLCQYESDELTARNLVYLFLF